MGPDSNFVVRMHHQSPDRIWKIFQSHHSHGGLYFKSRHVVPLKGEKPAPEGSEAPRGGKVLGVLALCPVACIQRFLGKGLRLEVLDGFPAAGHPLLINCADVVGAGA